MLQAAGNPDTGLWPPPQLRAVGRAWPFSGPMKHHFRYTVWARKERASLALQSVPSPRGSWRDTKKNRKPTTSQKSFLEQARKGVEQEGAGVAAAHAGTQGLSAEQTPQARHTHLPAEAPQSALTGDACGHSRQESRPKPEPPDPPALHLRASWQGMEWARSTSSRIIFCQKDDWTGS